MKKQLFIFFVLLLAITNVSAQNYADPELVPEKVIIKTPLTVEPGTSATNIYFTLSLSADEIEAPFVGYQMDVVLPEGLSIEYTKAGRPRVTLIKPGIYPSYTDYDEEDNEISVYTHSLNAVEVGDALRVNVYSDDSDESLRYFTAKSGDLLRVYVRPSAYLKPGDVNIILRDVTFGRMDATGNTVKQVQLSGVTASATSTIPLKITAANKFGTAIFPFDVTEIPVGLEVYSCNETDGEYLVLKQQQSINAYTPYLLYAANGFDGTLSGSVDATKYCETVTEGYLTGTLITQEIGPDGGHYLMQNKGEGAMFYKVTDTSFTVQPGKCWFTLPSDMQSAAAFRFGKPTAIKVPELVRQKSGIYDLFGRRINNISQRGIYIVDGEKVVK